MLNIACRAVVERIWRREGLKVPAKQPKRKRLWLNENSCIRLRAERPNHVSLSAALCLPAAQRVVRLHGVRRKSIRGWIRECPPNFLTHEGRKYRMLNVVDEFTRECLAIRIDRRLNSVQVIDVLSDLFIVRGVPDHIRSDNGPEFIAKAVQEWVRGVGAATAYITPGSPSRRLPANACRAMHGRTDTSSPGRQAQRCREGESFNARMRDELLNGEIFYSLREARIVIEQWRRHYNQIRPHSSLGYQAPAPEAVIRPPAWPSPLVRAAPTTPLPLENRPAMN